MDMSPSFTTSPWYDPVGFVLAMVFVLNVIGVLAGGAWFSVPSLARRRHTSLPRFLARFFLGLHGVVFLIAGYITIRGITDPGSEYYLALIFGASTALATLGSLAWWHLLSSAPDSNPPQLFLD